MSTYIYIHITYIKKQQQQKHHTASHKPSPHCSYHAGSTPCRAWLPRLGCEVVLLPIALYRAHWDPDVLHDVTCIRGMSTMYTWYTWIIFYVCYVSYLPNCHGWSWGLGKTFWWDSDSSIGRYFLAEEMMKWSFNKIIIKDILDALRKCQPLLKCWWSDDFATLGRYLKKSWQNKGLWLIVHTFTYPCCMN